LNLTQDAKMNYSTLIPVNDLFEHLGNPAWVVIDCRFTLNEPARGRRDYLAAHLPGAVYASLDEDLAGTVRPGVTGRHPLPPVERLVGKLSQWGIDSSVQVVAYDDSPGIGLSTAPRLWWMLRWLGHEKVAVLDGGWLRWVVQGMPFQAGVVNRPVRTFMPRLQPQLLADSAWVDQMRHDAKARLIDSRSADRYRGENETIDPVAGHILGAVCIPYLDNFGADSLFLPPQELRARFGDVTKGITPGNVAFYCGSGVTAANNVLAFAHAGLGDARLYAGSWSEWITDPGRPVEK
jgi:thiosulfate/3-mercaptopyruvate sulfurtransferase